MEELCSSCGQYVPTSDLKEGLCGGCYPLLPAAAYKELIEIAKTIALHQRGEHDIQPLQYVRDKLEHEEAEFNAEMSRLISEEQQLDLLSEAADLVYYAAQAAYHNHNVRPQVNRLLAGARIRKWTAVEAALVKYRCRATEPKNKDAEREALRRHFTGYDFYTE